MLNVITPLMIICICVSCQSCNTQDTICFLFIYSTKNVTYIFRDNIEQYLNDTLKKHKITQLLKISVP